AALEHRLAAGEGAPTDADDAGADIDLPWIEELGAEIDRDMRQHELAARRFELQLLVMKEADAARLEEGRVDRIVDMTLPIGVAVAQLVVRPDRVARALRRRSDRAIFRHYSAASRLPPNATPDARSASITCGE